MLTQGQRDARKAFGRKLKAELADRGLAIKDAAIKSGINYTTLHNWTTGLGLPRPGNMDQLLAVVDLSPELQQEYTILSQETEKVAEDHGRKLRYAEPEPGETNQRVLLGRELAKARIAKNLSQVQVEFLTGAGKQTCTKWEQGVLPTRKFWDKLARVLELSSEVQHLYSELELGRAQERALARTSKILDGQNYDGKWVYDNRVKLGLSQSGLANAIGLKSGTSVSLWEHGHTCPTPEQEISMRQLFGLEPVPEPADDQAPAIAQTPASPAPDSPVPDSPAPEQAVLTPTNPVLIAPAKRAYRKREPKPKPTKRMVVLQDIADTLAGLSQMCKHLSQAVVSLLSEEEDASEYKRLKDVKTVKDPEPDFRVTVPMGQCNVSTPKLSLSERSSYSRSKLYEIRLGINEKPFGTRLKECRDEVGFTQDVMARYLGISTDDLCAVEQSLKYPGVRLFERCMDEFHKTRDQLCPVYDYESFSELLQVIMDENDLTVSQFAAKCDLDTNRVYSFVAEELAPQLEELRKIAYQCKLDINILLNIVINPEQKIWQDRR